MIWRLAGFLWFALILGGGVRGDGSAENLLLVVNAGSPTSLAVANHYIHLRDIPPTNVVWLSDVPDSRTCSFEIFKNRVGAKTFQAMEERGLLGQIDFITFSTDFPTAVNCPHHLAKLRESVRLTDERLYKPLVSTNSLMTFWLHAVNEDPSFLLLDANWYFSRETGELLKTPFMGEEQAFYEHAIGQFDGGDIEEAIAALSQLSERHPRQVAVWYQLARALAMANRDAESQVALERAIGSGWQYREFTNVDRRLASLHNADGWEELLARIPDRRFGVMPSRGFSSQLVWGPNGWPNSAVEQGKRLWLCTLLGVAGGTRGNSEREIIDQLQRSVAADGTRPTGTFYFSSTDNVRTRVRAPQFAETIRELQALGLAAQQIPTRTPLNRHDVLGATLGAAEVEWTSSGNRFVAGALCDNLTSTGGVMRDQGRQTPLTEFLRHGAAGASGTVVEPLSIPAKFPSARLHLHYARGCNLAEAFYQAVSGPCQLLIVGDPLCRPWGRFPGFQISGLKDGDLVEADLDLELTPDADSPPIGRFEFLIDGRRVAVTAGKLRQVRVETEELSDGYHDLRVVAVEDSLIAARSVRRLGFLTRRNGHEIGFSVEGEGEYHLDRSVLVNASTNYGDRIEIRQHSRVVAEFPAPAGEARIDCRLLGTGPVTLTAVAIGESGEVAAVPREIRIVP
jgi:hypothetical protein